LSNKDWNSAVRRSRSVELLEATGGGSRGEGRLGTIVGGGISAAVFLPLDDFPRGGMMV
jgi:hypothetical protein